jgi:hypothetical protein
MIDYLENLGRNDSYKAKYEALSKAVDEAPAVDVAPVVHCCACKYFEMDTGFCCYWETGTRCDDFCSRGAKMDMEEEQDG